MKRNEVSEALQRVNERLYVPSGLRLDRVVLGEESAEYDACSFVLDGKKVEHRLSKITPTKVGQFVTVWKRNSAGITRPLTTEDDFDVLAVTACAGDRLGQFLLPKAALVEHRIVAGPKSEGKRGTRVYPPWDAPVAAQAIRSQAWQIDYFVRVDMQARDQRSALRALLGAR